MLRCLTDREEAFSVCVSLITKGDMAMNFDDFDKRFDRARRFAVIWMVFCGVAGFGSLIFVGWVIVKLLTHFGVV